MILRKITSGKIITEITSSTGIETAIDIIYNIIKNITTQWATEKLNDEAVGAVVFYQIVIKGNPLEKTINRNIIIIKGMTCHGKLSAWENYKTPRIEI